MSTEPKTSVGGRRRFALPTWRQAVWIVLGGGLVVLPLTYIPERLFDWSPTWAASNAAFALAAAAAIFAILAYAIAIPLRFLGLPSAGHGGLFAAGAYGGAIAMNDLGLGFEAGMVVAVGTATIVGVAMGALALRSVGLAFLIITLALGELVVLVVLNWDALTNGALGQFLTATPSVFGLQINSPEARYFVAMVVLFISIGVVALLARARLGRRLVAIRENEPLATSLGMNAFRLKLLAFVISAAIAGAAGHLYFIHLRAITPELFEVVAVISVFLMVVMGGVGSLAGPAVGAWLIVFLPVWLEPAGLESPARQELVFGVLLMAFMLLAPTGIMGGITSFISRVLRGSEARSEGSAETQPVLVGTHAPPVRSPNGSAREASRQPCVGEPMLRLEGVSKRFRGVCAVDEVSCEIRRGEVVGIIGPNGSGKTTLVNCIAGFTSVSSGRILWKGANISGKRPHARAQLGLMRTFQQSMSFGLYTPREHCALVWTADDEAEASSLGLSSVDEVLSYFGLDDVADVPASDLAYGHVSNLGVACTLATRLPELLILDEPAAGLSDVETRDLQERLLDLQDRGLTIVVIDHDMNFLMPMCNRLIVLDTGRQIAEGPPSEIQRDPKVVAAYLGERFAELSQAQEEPA